MRITRQHGWQPNSRSPQDSVGCFRFEEYDDPRQSHLIRIAVRFSGNPGLLSVASCSGEPRVRLRHGDAHSKPGFPRPAVCAGSQAGGVYRGGSAVRNQFVRRVPLHAVPRLRAGRCLPCGQSTFQVGPGNALDFGRILCGVSGRDVSFVAGTLVL